jgi:hypothetical protein
MSMRPLNLLIGLAIIVGISFVLFGSIGGKKKATTSGGTPSSFGSTGGLPQLEAAGNLLGPATSEPPPLPIEPEHPRPPTNERLEARLADPASLADARWEIARRRIREVFGGSLSQDVESAVQAAVGTWVAMQVASVKAYHGGYIDARGLGQHSSWNRNVYIQSLQRVLGHDNFQRYAGGGFELDEIAPGF